MEDWLARIWENLAERIDGPMSLRFILQPALATIFGILDGLRFAREGRSFMLWGGPEEPEQRRAQMAATWRSIGKVFIIAIVLDVLYQLFVLHWLYVLEALIVAVFVALIPYFIVRWLVKTVAGCWLGSEAGPKKPDKQSGE